MKILTPSHILMSLFFLLLFFVFGLPYLHWLHLRINWHNHAERLAEVTIPKNIESVDVDTLIAMNGEGFNKMALTLKPEQSITLLAEIQQNPQWQIEKSQSSIKFRCLTEDDVLYQKLNKEEAVEDINDHYWFSVYFCARSRVLHVYQNFR